MYKTVAIWVASFGNGENHIGILLHLGWHLLPLSKCKRYLDGTDPCSPMRLYLQVPAASEEGPSPLCDEAVQ